MAFAEALTKQPKHFDNLTINLIKAGENSGTLDSILDRVATYREKTEALKAKIKKALTYPIAVMFVAVIVTVVLLTWVVPQFEELFNNFDAELPLFTQMVIRASEVMQAKWYIFLAAIIAFVIIFKKFYNGSDKFRNFLDRVTLRLPVFGNILEKAIWARLTRTLSTTFAAGVPLLECLVSVRGAVDNAVYSAAIDDISAEVETGQTLYMAMRNAELFPAMMLQMVSIGEEAGSLDPMLAKVASFYEIGRAHV